MALNTWTPSVATGSAGPILTATQNGSLSTSDTYRFQNNGKTILSCDKGAGTCTATATTPGTLRGVGIADPTFTIAASTEDQIIGPFDPALFNDADGYCTFAFTVDVVGLTVTVIALP